MQTLELKFIPESEFKRINKLQVDENIKLSIIANMCRANALMAVKKAGSGHIGSSFSAMDIVVFLYYKWMNTAKLGFDHPGRDIYFSSKGHDVPGFYAVLYSLGVLSRDKILNLRRHGGLDGHPDVKIPGVEANTGSLGMGISKARGMAAAKKMKGDKGDLYVLLGDGELQEGQIWESLQATVNQQVNNIYAIVDNNKIQSDKKVSEISDLGNLKEKFESFGWHVEQCNGHDFAALESVFGKLEKVNNKPKIVIADTIKGKSISFMEGEQALKDGKGLYLWHSGAPGDDDFESGFEEIIRVVDVQLAQCGAEKLAYEIIETREKGRIRLKDVAEKVVEAYGTALLDAGQKNKKMVVLDADLAADCGLRPFEKTFPDRFIENGIAEQDMVSMAGGLALQGLLPIVNSFGVFLSSRSNEQIYTNATEGTKIIYVCHYSGLIPAGPGKSHQSLRDISLFGALPNCVILEPCNALETTKILDWCVNQSEVNCMIRLAISPSPRNIRLPSDYELSFGKGTVLKNGNDAIIFSYGPVMTHEAFLAAKLLEEKSVTLKIVNMPWLNRVDTGWLEQTIGNCNKVFCIDNHSIYGGLGDLLLNAISRSRMLKDVNLVKFGIDEYPACGTPKEVLQYHGLDGESLCHRIMS